MVNDAVRELLPEGSIIFSNHSYDNSIIGVTIDNRVVYSFNKMVNEFMKDTNVDYIDAVEWVEYNTIRSLAYMGGDNRPIIMYDLEDLF